MTFKRAVVLVIALALMGIAAAWFLTPLDDNLTSRMRTAIEGESTAGRGDQLDPNAAPSTNRQITRGPASENSPATAGFDMLKLALDALNAVLGLIGIFLALRAGRIRREPRTERA